MPVLKIEPYDPPPYWDFLTIFLQNYEENGIIRCKPVLNSHVFEACGIPTLLP